MPPLPSGQYRFSTVKWPGCYMYMQDDMTGNVRGWQGDAGPQGWWQVIVHPTQSDYYLLSTKKWPECFMFMQASLDGNARGWNERDPGPQGYFKLIPHPTERSAFLITAQEWEDEWFLYMQTGVSGNVRAWNTDPGPQGWWKIEPWNLDSTPSQALAPQMHLHASPPQGSGVTLPAPAPSSFNPNTTRSPYEGDMSYRTEPAGNMSYRPALGSAPPDRGQQLAEIVLDCVHAEGVDLQRLPGTDKIIAFHVDPSQPLMVKVGRQHQPAFFERLVPSRERRMSVSRTLFEIMWQAPSNVPMLRRLSSNRLNVGGATVATGEAVRISDDTCVGLSGTEDSEVYFLVLRVLLRYRGASASMATQMQLTCAEMSPALAMPQQIPQRVASSGRLPEAPPMSAVLECVYAVGQDLSRIPKQALLVGFALEAQMPLGRMHQPEFFEILFSAEPDYLQYISRTHCQARLSLSSRGSYNLAVENKSINAISIDGNLLVQGQVGHVPEGGILAFLIPERTLLEFKLYRIQ
mmetsp:Transcript_57770/g.96128  ORF Transcript_57770/g.96128 Transcript_57770/m.96128 type:complete len:520 (-) Transcript_57770:34-1593(-)